MIHALGSEIEEGPLPATGSCPVQAEFCKSLFYLLVTLEGGKVCWELSVALHSLEEDLELVLLLNMQKELCSEVCWKGEKNYCS